MKYLLFFVVVCLLLAMSAAAPVESTSSGADSQGPTLGFGDFNYTAGNTYDLPGPQEYPSGMDKGQVAGVVVGCILGGIFLGAMFTLCYLKRRRLFPARFGPPKHPDEAPAVHPIDVLRSGTKLDNLSKNELMSPNSFINTADANHADIRATDRV